MTLADAVAILRALAVIPVAWAIATDRHDIALVIFIVAALSDAADGWLARRTGTPTARGAFIDPVADKILVVGTLIALTATAVGWPVTVVTLAAIVREGIVLVARYRALAHGVSLPADGVAKLKTVAEMLGTALVIVGGRPWAVLGAIIVGVAVSVGFLTLPRYRSR